MAFSGCLVSGVVTCQERKYPRVLLMICVTDPDPFKVAPGNSFPQAQCLAKDAGQAERCVNLL